MHAKFFSTCCPYNGLELCATVITYLQADFPNVSLDVYICTDLHNQTDYLPPPQ